MCERKQEGIVPYRIFFPQEGEKSVTVRRTMSQAVEKVPICVNSAWAGRGQGSKTRRSPLSVSHLFGCQVLVFHFPSVVHGVKGSVPNQESERPFRHLACQLTLCVVVSYCVAIGIPMRFQPLVSQHRTIGGEHTDPLRPILLVAKHMANNIVPITPSASRTFLHLSRHSPTHIVKKCPARLHQRQLTFQFEHRHTLLVDARKGERDTPEVS